MHVRLALLHSININLVALLWTFELCESFLLVGVVVVTVFVSAAVYNHHRHSLRRQQRLHRQCQFYDSSLM